jgi:peptide deformylase
MAVKPIVLYKENEEALRKKSEPVRAVNRRTKKIVKDLKDTLLDRNDGIGLAAPQIDVPSRVVVVRLNSRSDGQSELDPPIALINPEIVEAQNDERDFDGCLSFPGLYAETVRPHYLRVTGLDEWGKPFDRVFEGFDAVLVHHEIDHLNGVLFVDRVENLEDIYTVRENEDGELVRVPVSAVGQ